MSNGLDKNQDRHSVYKRLSADTLACTEITLFALYYNLLACVGRIYFCHFRHAMFL